MSKAEIRCAACTAKLGEFIPDGAKGELFILCKKKIGTGAGKCNVLNRVDLEHNKVESVSFHPKTRVLRV